MADGKGLNLSSAPCSVLGEAAQALALAVARNDVGTIRIVYAELDDIRCSRRLESPHGTPWPWRDEFSVGCTLEHAGYHLSWLIAYFGSIESVTALSSCLVPANHPALSPEQTAADFSVACIKFRSGVVARLTCSIVAPHDHSLRIIGDKSVLSVEECWHNGTPI